MEKNKVALFVCSPNAYADVLKIFVECKKKNWPDCPYDFVLVTNDQKYDGIKVYNNYNEGDGWVERALPVIKSLNYEYLILFADDAFISASVNTRTIDGILDIMDQKHIKYCRLKHYSHGKTLKELPSLSYVNTMSPYGVNLHKGIFKKEFLLSLLGDGTKTCWQVENEWNQKASQSSGGFYSDIVACKNEVVPTLHGLEKGLWFPSAKKKLKKMGFDSFGVFKEMSVKTELFSSIKTFFGDALPPKIRNLVKSIMKKIGFKFAINN